MVLSKIEEKTVCILARDKETKKLKFDFTALASVLTNEKIKDKPIVILSVNGEARTGKSFLLSNLLGCLSNNVDRNWIENAILNAFPWRNGEDSQTKGIHISTQPLITNREDGREIGLILMDVEGSFCSETTVNENAITFAVSAILSSVLIFNVTRRIDEGTLLFLSIFCSFANQAKSEGNGDRKYPAFQKLIFLVRDYDFTSQYKWGYYNDNEKPNGQEINFKKSLLDPQSISVSAETLKTRENLRKWFKEIAVYLMPDPGKALRLKDKVNELDPEFKEHLFEFIKCMITDDNLKIKKIHDKEVTAVELLEKVSYLVELFDGEKLPTVDTIFGIVEKMKYREEKANAIDHLFKLIPADSIPNNEEIENFFTETLAKFQAETYLTNQDYIKRFREELKLIIEFLRVITSYKEAIKFLKELLVKAEALDTGCKIGKTTGTAFSSGGALLAFGSALSAIFAPVLTIQLGGAALTAGLAGGATTVTTNIANKAKSEKLFQELIRNQSQRSASLQTICRRLPGFEDESGTTMISLTTATNSVSEISQRFSAINEIYDQAKQWTANQPLTYWIQSLIDKYEKEITAWQYLSRTLEV